jgi:hypothetical protein
MMSTQPVAAGTPASPPTRPLPNKVDGVFQATINEPQNTTATPLVGPPPDVKTDFVNQIASLPVMAEEAAKENCLKLISIAQELLEKAYQEITLSMTTQEKIDRLKELETLFNRLNEVHLLWCPNKAYRPAIQGYLNASGRYDRLQQYVASKEQNLFVKIFTDLCYAVDPINLNTQCGSEILADIYTFLDSGNSSLSPKERYDLFDELLDKLTLFTNASSQVAQLKVSCQNKISELKPIEPDSSDRQRWFTEEYMFEQIDAVTKHLTDLYKTHQELFARVKFIPKSIRASLEENKKRLTKIYDWIANDLLLSRETKVSILKLVRDQFERMHLLIEAWEGKKDQDTLNRMGICIHLILHLSPNEPLSMTLNGKVYTLKRPSATRQPVSHREIPSSTSETPTPKPPTRHVRPTKPNRDPDKILLTFKTAIFALLVFSAAFLLHRRFKPLSYS